MFFSRSPFLVSRLRFVDGASLPSSVPICGRRCPRHLLCVPPCVVFWYLRFPWCTPISFVGIVYRCSFVGIVYRCLRRYPRLPLVCIRFVVGTSVSRIGSCVSSPLPVFPLLVHTSVRVFCPDLRVCIRRFTFVSSSLYLLVLIGISMSPSVFTFTLCRTFSMSAPSGICRHLPCLPRRLRVCLGTPVRLCASPHLRRYRRIFVGTPPPPSPPSACLSCGLLSGCFSPRSRGGSGETDEKTGRGSEASQEALGLRHEGHIKQGHCTGEPLPPRLFTGQIKTRWSGPVRSGRVGCG